MAGSNPAGREFGEVVGQATGELLGKEWGPAGEQVIGEILKQTGGELGDVIGDAVEFMSSFSSPDASTLDNDGGMCSEPSGLGGMSGSSGQGGYSTLGTPSLQDNFTPAPPPDDNNFTPAPPPDDNNFTPAQDEDSCHDYGGEDMEF